MHDVLKEILRGTTDVKERAIFIEFKALVELICEHSYLHMLSNIDNLNSY